MIDADGASYPVDSHVAVLAVAAEHDLDVYVGRLPQYPWLAEAMRLPGTQSPCDRAGKSSGLACRYKRKVIRIGQSDAWGFPEPTPEFLTTLTALFDLVNVGAYLTPAALGHAKMVRVYKESHHPYQSRPNKALRRALLEHRIGARADPPISPKSYSEVWEIDLHDAYAAIATGPLPVGPVERILAGCDLSTYVHWFCRCYVYLPYSLRNSPVLLRAGDGQLTPLTEAGQHELWLRKAEAEELEKLGATVIPREGWGWLHLAPVLAEWAQEMHQLRGQVSGELARMVKCSIVAGLGRHGMAPVRHSLVPLADSPDGARVIVGGPGGGEYAIVTQDDPESPCLHHWFDYILMQIRLWQWRVRVAEEQAGNTVIATDTDALYLLEEPTTVAAEPTRLGGARITRHHNRRFPYPRAWVQPNDSHLPGIPKTARQPGWEDRLIVWTLERRLARARDRPTGRWRDREMETVIAELMQREVSDAVSPAADQVG